MTTYEYRWHFYDSNQPMTSEQLTALGADGWRIVQIISRPGMLERLLTERPISKPTGRGGKAER